jgi:hypothetical protein
MLPSARQWLVACTFSAEATALNRRATCASPSFSAFSAQMVYFMYAMLSPANASSRFFCVILCIVNTSILRRREGFSQRHRHGHSSGG